MLLSRKPVLCNYYVTYRCNATCSFCDIWEKPSPYIKEENVRENLRDLKKMGVRVIDFTGGEPLLHRQLHIFLRMAKEMGFITTVTTNGLLYPKRANQLHGLIDMLHFSLDSPDPEKHNQSRGVECFDFVMEGIRMARAAGERPDIIFTVFEENLEDIERVYEEISRPNELMLILNPVFSYNGVGESLSEASLKMLKTWARKPDVYLNEGFLQLRLEGGNDPENPVCRADVATVVISPENKLVLPCYHLGLEEMPIEGNLAGLFHSAKVKEERNKAGKLPECEGCVINCYMEPSMAVEVNRYFLPSMISTLKYSLAKFVYS